MLTTFVYNYEHARVKSLNCVFYRPDSMKEMDKIPLIVFLHGAGERGDDFGEVYKFGLTKYLKEGEEFPAAILAPHLHTPSAFTWNRLTSELMELIEHTVKTYGIDPDRVSITGISMGGFGTWEMIGTYPGYFSAAAPICGGGMGWQMRFHGGKTPAWAFHGDMDETVPLSMSMDMYNGMVTRGVPVRLTIFHGEGHECWDMAYKDTKVIDWLVSHKREW